MAQGLKANSIYFNHPIFRLSYLPNIANIVLVANFVKGKFDGLTGNDYDSLSSLYLQGAPLLIPDTRRADVFQIAVNLSRASDRIGLRRQDVTGGGEKGCA